MFPQFVIQCFKEHLIGDFSNIHAGIIQNGNDPFVLLFHQIHNDLVVEIINLQNTKQVFAGLLSLLSEKEADELYAHTSNHTGRMICNTALLTVIQKLN